MAVVNTLTRPSNVVYEVEESTKEGADKVEAGFGVKTAITHRLLGPSSPPIVKKQADTGGKFFFFFLTDGERNLD